MHSIRGLTIFVLAVASAATHAMIVSMPERVAAMGDEPVRKTVVEFHAIPTAGKVYLAEPGSVEVARAKSDSRPNTIGIGRPVLPTSGGRFEVPAGTQSVRVEIQSAGARYLRVGLILNRDVSYRVEAWGATDSQTTGMDATGAGSSAAPTWTPLTRGDTQFLVVTRNTGSDSVWAFEVVALSHVDAPLSNPAVPTDPKAFGDSAPCQLDVACLQPLLTPADWNVLLGATRGVMLMLITSPTGTTGACTGTLLNSASYPTAFVMTANHCIDDGVTGMTTLWFFSRPSCGSGVPANFVQMSSPGSIVWRSASLDSALLRLNITPPAPAVYAGWDASKVTPGELALAVHHPRADAKKASLATVVGENFAPVVIGGISFAPRTFYVIDWEVGIVEHGSSGSGLFTHDASIDAFMLRATLTGGSPTCSSTKSRTYYSSLANAYPFIQSHLTTPTNLPPPPSAKVQAVEYFHSAFGHYFITANADEIAKLDNGTFVGWARTGQGLTVYTGAPSGSAPVCRFFSAAFSPKSSHFYTPDVAECAKVKGNGNWQFEAVVFSTMLPNSAGACGAGTLPVYRMYNNGQSGAPNHRYTTSTTVRSQMLSRGWVPEGYGSVGVVMCAPQ